MSSFSSLFPEPPPPLFHTGLKAPAPTCPELQWTVAPDPQDCLSSCGQKCSFVMLKSCIGPSGVLSGIVRLIVQWCALHIAHIWLQFRILWKFAFDLPTYWLNFAAAVEEKVCEPPLMNSSGPWGGDSAGPRMPTNPPPPLGASDQQLVAKGATLRSPWAPDAPWAPKAPEGFCPLCTPTLSLNPTLTLTPTPNLSLVPALHLPLALTLTRALTRMEYWDRAGGGTSSRRLQQQMRYAIESG